MKKSAYRPYEGKRRHPALLALACLLIVAVAAFAALEVYIGLGSRTHIAGEPEIMVVFGCQVKPWGPSTLLQDRLDTALAYLEDHPDMTVVVTGGKGDDEHISEAQCMYDYLTANGAEGDNILMEDRSRNTWQNVNYTHQLLLDEGLDVTEGVLLVSSGFHLSRIEILWARGTGMLEPSTLAAPVSHIPSKIHMFFREPLALVKSFVFDR